MYKTNISIRAHLGKYHLCKQFMTLTNCSYKNSLSIIQQCYIEYLMKVSLVNNIRHI